MKRSVYHYKFAPEISVDEIRDSLLLAVLAAQALHGEVQVRLDAQHEFDSEQRACSIDGSTTVGNALNQLFLGFIVRQFGDDVFSVERFTAEPATASLQPTAN